MLYRFLYGLLFVLLISNCNSDAKRLPILNDQEEVNGELVHKHIPAFRFVNQDSQIVTNQTFAGKAYVADFFFTSCPTICPVMQQHMLEIYQEFEDETKLALISHTIDPRRDTVGRLKQYANNLGINSNKWHIVTGPKDSIYQIADDYFNIVIEDPTLPEGFDHSGRFTLVDPNGHIRAYCNGTDSTEIKIFIHKIERLLDEIKADS